MHGFGFFPGAFFWPAVIFFGLLKFLFIVLIIGFIIRLIVHAGHHGHGHGYGYGPGWRHGYGHGGGEADPRRMAAWRFAAGQIDRAEFDRIMAGLDAAAASTPQQPAPPAPPAPQA